ncbi:MAG: TIGR03643 family protein [Cytophagaceae bacterium]|jgi:uncharacterized protein (TIGR03643 family)|nr:TIGR03643 family protein [Cytophagaceae bacterium]
MKNIPVSDLDRIVEMAWEDRTPFEAIFLQFGLQEKDVIELMRSYLLPNSFKRWRKRVSGNKLKHLQRRGFSFSKFKCQEQRAISFNRISKKR